MKSYVAQMKEYKQDKALNIYLPLYQCMLNMTGPQEEALLLKGEAISEKDFEEKKFANSTIMSYQMQLAYYFDDMELAETLSNKLQEVSKSFNAHYLFVARLFFFGMIALRLAFAASGRKRKQHLRIARKMIAEMEQWTSHGGLNCLHKLLILRAEMQGLELSLLGRRRRLHHFITRKAPLTFDTVHDAFDRAIVTSIRAGFHNDAALACERATALCQRNNATPLEERYRRQAIEYYTQWGATAKVKQLTCGGIGFRSIVRVLEKSIEFVAPGRSPTRQSDHQKLLSHPFQSSELIFTSGDLLASASDEAEIGDESSSAVSQENATSAISSIGDSAREHIP